MTIRRNPGACATRATSATPIADHQNTVRRDATRVDSRQVSWWSVHEFIEATVAQLGLGPLPSAGSPSWCALADGDPRKLLAVAIDGEHHVLRKEAAQEARAEASKALSMAEDWSRVAQRSIVRAAFYEAHPWLKRVVT
jgi:hypothetical protein